MQIQWLLYCTGHYCACSVKACLGTALKVGTACADTVRAVYKTVFVWPAECSGRTSLAIPVLHQAAWRIICASPTKPYCLLFPHECPQMCSSSKSVKLLPGNKLCVWVSQCWGPEGLPLQLFTCTFCCFLFILNICIVVKAQGHFLQPHFLLQGTRNANGRWLGHYVAQWNVM